MTAVLHARAVDQGSTCTIPPNLTQVGGALGPKTKGPGQDSWTQTQAIRQMVGARSQRRSHTFLGGWGVKRQRLK